MTITRTKEGYSLMNDGEGMVFSEKELEEALKEILYRYF